MSNFAALGFQAADTQSLESLARLPLRRARGIPRYVPGGPVNVHRLELGDGIELWTVRQGDCVVASYPFFRARRERELTVNALAPGPSRFTPRLRVDETPAVAFQLVNYLLLDSDDYASGRRVKVALAALLGRGVRPAPPGLKVGLTPELEAVGCPVSNQVGLCATVLECQPLVNPLTAVELCWWRLGMNGLGEVEAVGEAPVPGVAEVGRKVMAKATLRGAVTAVWRPGPGEGEVPDDEQEPAPERELAQAREQEFNRV